MAQPVLARPRTPDTAAPTGQPHGGAPAATSSTRSVHRVGVAGLDAAPGAVEFLLDAESLTETTVALAAARADVIRLVHSAVLPTPAAVRALVDVLAAEIAAVGRDRTEVRVVLQVEAVVARDEADAARRREAVTYAEAFSGAVWASSVTWLVAPVERLVADAHALAARAQVDAVELALVGASAALAPAVAAAAA
ncbi:hypothetical protein [Cellulomonas shaoxiangyii]|uniref:LLM class flavin-dependent oxidoreductase n=1 Tax=Cellulomonas shaoxiangyii TaxID=2566013 RepID=A0A4P7SF64_9CELL|nr:hypothetical protein [Cellulomonas shaoxiangyii]QCB92622.1 hypothetical protein E5225_02695 [Cellulomonas shaoxiangyii]TGY85222.1 hypothetical protein E5226_07360 [Cellulomonas shaoxiangyii]